MKSHNYFRFPDSQATEPATIEIQHLKIVVDNSSLGVPPSPFTTIGDYIAQVETSPEKAALLAQARKRLAKRIAAATGEPDLSQLRLSLGLSQVQVAKGAELAQSQISKAEAGADMQMSTLEKIARALNVDDVLCFKAYKEAQLRAKALTAADAENIS
jgi:DNA-binding XRE family transcriptional regulator